MKRFLASTGALAALTFGTLGLASPASAACTINGSPPAPSDVQIVPSGATVNCAPGTETRSFDGRPNDTSTTPAVGFDATIRNGATLVAPGSGGSGNPPALFFGPGSSLVVEGTGRIESPGGSLGMVVMTGPGNSVRNDGTLSVKGSGSAIQGGFKDGAGLSAGLNLVNTGTVNTTDPSAINASGSATVNASGSGAIVENSGMITRNAVRNAALLLGTNGRLTNSGEIAFRATTASGGVAKGSGVSVAGPNAQIINTGIIRAKGDGSQAVSIAGGSGATIENGSGGSISASGGAIAIAANGSDIVVSNRGRIDGGTQAAVSFTGENANLRMLQGGALTGNVVARTTAEVLKTMQDLGLDPNNPRQVAAYNARCGGTSPAIACLHTVSKFPSRATVEYERSSATIVDPTTTEFGGINRFVLNGRGPLTLSQAFSAGSQVEIDRNNPPANNPVLTGNFSDTLEFQVTDPGAVINLSGVVSDNPAAPDRFQGSLRKSGDGTLILTGTNTYTGGTTIEGGTLQLGDAVTGSSVRGLTGSIRGDVDIRSGATLLVNRIGDASRFDGRLSGAGRFVLQSGRAILTGTNTYTGGTEVAGNLTVGNGATSGSIVGNVNVARGGLFNFARSDSIGFGGTISGAGQVSHTGTGRLALSGNSTYTGRTLVGTGGTLVLDGSLTSDVLVYRSQAATRGSRIEGSGSTTGSLTVQNGSTVAPGSNGIGTLTVGDFNLIAGSVLEVDAVESAGGGLSADVLRVNGRASFGAARVGGGAPFGPTVLDVMFNANTQLPALEGINVLVADGGLQGQAPSIVLDPASLPGGQNFHLNLEALNIAGSGPSPYVGPGQVLPPLTGNDGLITLQVIKENPVVQNVPHITVINAPYLVPTKQPVLVPSLVPSLVPGTRGPTATPIAVPVLAPTLVKGPTSVVTTPIVVKPRGSVAPPKTGIATKNGGVQLGGGTLVPLPRTPTGGPTTAGSIPIGTVSPVVVVDPPEQVTELGTVFIPADNNNTNIIVVDPPEQVTNEFVSIVGSYGRIDQTHARPGTKFALIYQPHTVSVAHIPSNYGNLRPLGVRQSRTQRQVGGILTETLPEAHARPANRNQANLISGLYPLPLGRINGVLDSIAGVDEDPTFVTVLNTREFQDSIDHRLRNRRDGTVDAEVDVSRAGGDPMSGRVGWGKVFGGYAEGDYLNDSEITTWGLVLGADQEVTEELVAGVAVSYAAANIDNDPGSNDEVRTLEAAAYGSWVSGDWFVSGNIGASYNWLEMDRAISVGGFRDSVSGETDASSFFTGVEVGRVIAMSWGAVEPTAGLRYQYVDREGYTEEGPSTLAREISGVRLNSGQGLLGVRAYGNYRGSGAILWRPEVRIGYARELGDSDIEDTASFVDMPGTSFDVFTAGPGDDVGILGLRLDGEGPGADYYFDYQAEAREGLFGQAVAVGLSIAF